MFPDITREDVFRIETRRLWLRWPAAADMREWPLFGDAGAAPESSTGDPFPDEAALRTIERLRAENTAGKALHLVLNGQGPDRRAFGLISLAPVCDHLSSGLRLQAAIAGAHAGQGYMTESVQALVDAAFMLTEAPLVSASARVLDPAFRRVLEKCGFSYCGTGLDESPVRAGLVASDRFRLDRKAWSSLKSWRVPALFQRPKAAEAARCCMTH